MKNGLHMSCSNTFLLPPSQPIQKALPGCPYWALAGQPLELVKPEALRFKVFEPILVIGRQKVKNLDIRLRVKGGGHVSQIYGTLPL